MRRASGTLPTTLRIRWACSGLTSPMSWTSARPDERMIRTRSAVIGGRTINYTAYAGALPVRDKDGELIGEVAYTAFIADGEHVNRPITFAFNASHSGEE